MYANYDKIVAIYCMYMIVIYIMIFRYADLNY